MISLDADEGAPRRGMSADAWYRLGCDLEQTDVPRAREAYLLAAKIMCENFSEDQKARQILEFVTQTYPTHPLKPEIEKYQKVIDQLGRT